MDSLVIDVDRIEHPRERFERALTRGFLKSVFEDAPAYAVVDPSTIVVHLTRVGAKDVLLEGSTQVSVESACRRCLKPVRSDLPIVFQLDLVWRPSAAAKGERPSEDRGQGSTSASFDEHEIDEEPFDGERVDLGPIAREQLLLALPPIEPACSESCRGLCPTCGQDLNEADCGHARLGGDPRWARLRDLKV